jgi:hypothetical protein
VQFVDEGGAIVRLVTALAKVVVGASGPAALIAGLAALARAAGAYRVTNDVDAVAEPNALGLVLAAHRRPGCRDALGLHHPASRRHLRTRLRVGSGLRLG